MIVALVLAGIVAVALILLIACTAVWLLMPEPDPPGPHFRRPVYDPEPADPYWIRQLPRSRTPWDATPAARAEIHIAALLAVLDRAPVPCLQPGWRDATMRKIGAL